ncbi:pitrilysin family protein [Tersicoccus sp. Bi-70]|uniref:M16 family metallopeptidase n=1 Tax=Tersicoccus sp. Bi-70 TaxID=1897634 RepID=UPI000977E30F|nr:pitrilysin family protein [Tersicoccus sp. Bi-70]OMH31196.1 zinc protease [Tersicoccus sp. Bi-70]
MTTASTTAPGWPAAPDSPVRRSVLPGGVRVLTEAMPGQRAVTVGFWIAVGSRDEAAGEYGSTHFLEHLLFKGTPTRSALDIASAFDAVGGESNAATAKESTCYYAHVLDEHLPMAIATMADMVTSASLDAEELEQERTVILEELAMASDDPADVAHERFAAAVLGDHALGRPIGGTPEIIRSVGRESVSAHYQRYYRPDELVVTAAGSLDHDAVCGLVLEALRRSGWELDPDAVPVDRRSETAAVITPETALQVVQRPVEQANIILGTGGLNATDDRRFALSVLNAALGGGMSSRLFQEIREKRGLAYSTYSFAAGYADAGYVGLYAGCSPARVPEVLGLLESELGRLADHGLDAEELDRAKGQLRGGLVLGLEDTASRMSRLGRAELVHGRFIDLDESLDRVQRVTPAQVTALARTLASGPRSTVVVGPFEDTETFGL